MPGDSLKAKDIMHKLVFTVNEDCEIPDMVRYLRDRSFAGCAVVDGKGALVGTVSLSDVAQSPARGKVREIMSRQVHRVAADATLAEICQLFLRGQVARIFVMGGGHMQGIITASDLVRVMHEMSLCAPRLPGLSCTRPWRNAGCQGAPQHVGAW